MQCPVTCHAGDLSAIHNHDFFTLVFRSFQSQQRISKNPTCFNLHPGWFFIMAEVFPHAKLAGCPWMTYLFFWCPDLWKPICKWPDFGYHASKPWISWIETRKTGTWYHAELRIFGEIAIPKFHLKCHGGVTYMHDFWLLNHHFHVRMASLQEWNTAIGNWPNDRTVNGELKASHMWWEGKLSYLW